MSQSTDKEEGEQRERKTGCDLRDNDNNKSMDMMKESRDKQETK